MIRWIVLGIWLVVPAVAWSQGTDSASPPVLTLEQAIALALQHNRLVQNAVFEVEKVADQRAAARTRRLPSLNFSLLESQLITSVDFEFKRGAFGTFPTTGPIPPHDATIRTPRRLNTLVTGSAVQPISQLYRIGLGLQQLEAGQQIAQERLRLQRQSVANEVKRAYYGLLQTQSALEAAEEALQFYQELDRTVGEQVAQQQVLLFESLDVKPRLARAEYEIFTLRNALTSQKEQLNDFLGRDLRTHFQVGLVPTSTPLEVDLEAACARALQQRPELKEARLRVRQAEYDLRIKRSEYLPDISLAFNYVSSYQVEVLPQNVASVGLMVRWELFDWGRKRRELSEKGRAIQQANNEVDRAESLIVLDVNHRFRKLQESRELLRIGQLAQQAARERVRVTRNRYTLQAALSQDLLQAQASLAEANHQARQSLLSLWMARADFEKALGEE
ncbi:MAG: TolC family protein [Candidatus Tectomicrobia bacterium]|uniref:TolC family protein n=1 Tax=Tectimicrobiota bacterium TaxID=2528274 RepID=A0A932FVH8_UNCTE|nr:TolC family protein [Candidatus Tectomicrobia bacterium]